jgi:hypothetical protein
MAPGYSIEINGRLYRVAAPNTSIVAQNEHTFSLIETVANSPMTPEEEIIDREEKRTRKVTVKGVTLEISLQERLSSLVELYKKRTPEQQMRILELFMKWLQRRNGSQKEMQEEINQVRRMIYNLKKKIAKSKSANKI